MAFTKTLLHNPWAATRVLLELLSVAKVHLQEEVSIQNSQGLDSIAALDPEAEYKSRLASSFSVHFRRVAENACRSIFLALHDADAGGPQWVSVQKSRQRTPVDEASEQDSDGTWDQY